MTILPRPAPDPLKDGQESVWGYPRPAVLVPHQRRITVVVDGALIVDAKGGFRVLETSHPPTYYISPADVVESFLEAVPGQGSFCEWKGAASYYDVVTSKRRILRACWAYQKPSPSFRAAAGFIAFYAGLMDECRVDGELVTPQPGRFYGGWITSDIAGPFKGGVGSEFW